MPLAICSVSPNKPFPGILEKFLSVGDTSRDRHRSEQNQSTLSQKVKKRNMRSWVSNVFFSQPTGSPAQSSQQAARVTPLCSSSPLMDIWGYLAQKLHLPHQEHNVKVWCCLAIFLKASTRDFSVNRDKRKKLDPEFQPSCGTEQSHCFKKWGFVSPLTRV